MFLSGRTKAQVLLCPRITPAVCGGGRCCLQLHGSRIRPAKTNLPEKILRLVKLEELMPEEHNSRFSVEFTRTFVPYSL